MEAGQEGEDAPGSQHIHLTLSSICRQGDASMQDAAAWEGPQGWKPLPPHQLWP